jgi:secreted Zn-dependent insulinase-like peptidase
MSSKTLESKCDKVEEWYSTKYSIESFSEDLLKRIRSPNVTEKTKKLGLPSENTLIAQNLDVIDPNKENSKFP